MGDGKTIVRRLGRRQLLLGAGALGAGAVLGRTGRVFAQAPAIVTPDKARPQTPSGLMSGDISADRAVIWSRTDRPAQMVVEWATNGQFRDARRIEGPAALATSDYTARVDLSGLPAGEQVFYRVTFRDLADWGVESAPLIGRLRTPARDRRAVTFAFSGDEAGQGWGINTEWGGYRLYETMRRHDPDFFIHSGDQIYADGPLKAQVTLDDGTIWKNVVTEAKAKVAETLDEFRGAFAYNLMDENKRRFAAETPFLVQWDDHEARNNWFPGQTIGDDRYKVRSAALLAAYAKRAMFEYNPMRPDPSDPERVYRDFHFGPMLDVIMIDERTYRGPNTANRQASMGAEAAFLGPNQISWLKARLKSSKAVWKVIASDMPLSIVVPDANPDAVKGTYEAWANAENGPPTGRELEIAEILSFIKANKIKNVVWITADVHYAAAFHYKPQQAKFANFDPFWEFVAGPINAGTFGPNDMDLTFGPSTEFLSVPQGMKQNRPPTENRQYFGIATIDAKTAAMTVALYDVNDQELYKVELPPARG